MGKSTSQQPIQPIDILAGAEGAAPDTFSKVPTNPSTILGGFNTNEYSYLDNPTPFNAPDAMRTVNRNSQPLGEALVNSLQQFGANFVASVGQGLANTFDLISTAKTIKGELTGSDDDFSSSLFGISTKEMQDWAHGVAERNQIMEDKPGSFSPSDMGWWLNQFAQTGTGVGMAVEALGVTLGIEAATGGTGTAAALTKLGSLFKKITRGGRTIEAMNDALSVARGLKSAATVYGTISRYSESRMEASANYAEIYNDLSNQKNEDGSDKYSEEQKAQIASEGARRTFNLNMALLPLDILGYRTMMFNPVSGSATGLIERGLAKIGNKWIRKGVQGLTFSALEGAEEGAQFIAQEEGQHYARVLGGLSNGSSFLQRLSDDVQTDEFWNNVAGGVIGGPVIAGTMHLANKAMSGGRAARLNQIHQHYINNVGRMDNALAERIKDYEKEGMTKEAEQLRRQFSANKALGAMHLDAMTDSTAAFDAHSVFLDTVIGELTSGKTDALNDLGYENVTHEQVQQILIDFTQYKKDSQEMKGIYDNVKDKYNKNYLPEITFDYFRLNRMTEALNEVGTTIATKANTLMDYNSLSPYGKQIYDVEYELTALTAEDRRLKEMLKNANDRDKAAIQEVIEQNKTKLDTVKLRLRDIQQYEDYKAEDVAKDNSILSSTLKDREYTQAIYDKTALENSITLQRKKIALWNDSTYIAERNREAITAATNAPQLDATQEAIATQGNVTPEDQDAIDEQRAAIAAQEAAAQMQANANQQSAIVPGDGNLFEEDNAAISGMLDAANPAAASGTPNLSPDGLEYEALFAPSTYDFDKSSEDAKAKIINGVNGILNRLGQNPTFEDLVRQVVRVQGASVADQIFNALKYGWEKNGMSPVDYQAIYDKVFGNPYEQLMGGVQGLVETPTQVQAATTQVTEQIVANQGTPEFDNNNQPHYTYTGTVTHEALPKFAFVTRLAQLVQQTDESGDVIVSYEYTDEELNYGDYVDSLQLLDPDKFNPGTEMVIKVPTNFMDIRIPVYEADGSKGKTMTFGQYVASRLLSPTDQEYQDKIPMIIYRKGAPAGEKGLAFVHDIGWYHPLRFNQDRPTDMADAIKETREVRSAVMDDAQNSTGVTIVGKRQTTFSGLKLPENTFIPLRQANPETQIAVALSTDTLNTSRTKGGILFPNDNTTLMNDPVYRVGQVFDIRRYGVKDGKKSYMAFPVWRPKIDEASKQSVLQAITIYATRSTTNPQIKERNERVKQQVLDITGLDLYNPRDLEIYLRQFINTLNSEKAKTNEDVESRANAKLSPGTPYISFIMGGNIVFGRTGEPAYTHNNKTYNSFFVNPNSTTNPQAIIANLNKPIMLGYYEQFVDINNLNNKSRPVVFIDKDFGVTTASASYNDFLLDRLQTNVRSFNIGTEETPNWVTNIQPVITFQLNSKLQQSVPTNEQVAEQVMEQVETTEEQITQQEATEDLAELERQIIEQARGKLGNALHLDDEMFAPNVLSEEAKKRIGESINRIAGLTPNEQYDIVDFMYNQVTAMVSLDNKVVPRATVYSEVRKAFDAIVVPTKAELQSEIDRLNDMIKQKPLLANSKVPNVIRSYEHQLSKIKDIEDSFDILQQETFAKVAKYTGITEDTVTNTQEEEDNTEENPDDTPISPDEEARGTKDFWTDVLTENPENKLNYMMRRFFGQIRKYDKRGQPAVGFLGLPTYTGADTVIRTLMVTLADVPSDFETMMKKLEERKEGIPWMQEVIDRLRAANSQIKNQFVTAMGNTSLRMKFTMISFNRKNNTWTTKVYDTNQSGVADSIKNSWRANFYDSGLVYADEEGNYILNQTKAKAIMHTFENWKGKSLHKVLFDMTPYRATIDKVKTGKPVTFTPNDSADVMWLNQALKSKTDRVSFSLKGQEFQITNLGNNQFQIARLEKTVATNDEVAMWLEEFGINLSYNTVEELMTKGIFHNKQLRKPTDLFTTDNGLFQILYNNLSILTKKPSHNFTEDGGSPLDESVVDSLANLEAKYNDVVVPFGFRDNGKSLFALTAPKFINNRIRDLKNADSPVANQLRAISFSQPSFWLELLKDENFRNKFNVSHLGLNAFKELGKKLYRDNGITKLSDTDHELTKLGMFWDMTQGEILYDTVHNGAVVSTKNYPGTTIALRIGTMFSPTMSDKSLMTVLTTAVLDLQNKDLNSGEGISEEVIDILYSQLVSPELKRMTKFWQNGGRTNISAYDKGAKMFLMLPELNNLEVQRGLRLVDLIKNSPNTTIEGNPEIMKQIRDTIKAYVNQLVTDKLVVWNKDGIVGRKDNNEVITKYFDKKYFDKFRGTPAQKVKMAAMDYVINYLVSNANSFMTIAGDPAMSYKSKKKDALEQARETFVNVGKRLAAMIAPGTALANSENEKYIQLFLEDRKVLSETPFLKFVTKINDGQEITDQELAKLSTGTQAEKDAIVAKYPISSGYFGVDISDGQEYTTWKEHLNILERLGKTSDLLQDITPADIQEARELFASGTPKAKLTERQLQLMGKVLQPMKPVYTGQIFDPEQDVMRTVYIKCSSFPLIPQLTAGFEIDKVRQQMEKIEKSSQMTVRASYQSANKVGSLSNAAKVWNDDGTINEGILNDLQKYSLVLDRKNFRIQQEVPFKSGKKQEDKITLGTQLMKLLFGDEIMNLDGFIHNGVSHTGAQLQQIYNTTFINLVNEKKNQLYDELGLDQVGRPIDVTNTTLKLQSILKDEAIKRGYPLQDIQGLTLDENGEFNLPLWASSNSNRYESMLNSIVTNRVIRMKFPGVSYVVGSEEGFKIQEETELPDNIDELIIKENLIGNLYLNEDGKKKRITKDNVDAVYAMALEDDENILDSRGNIMGLPSAAILAGSVDYANVKRLKEGFTNTSYDAEDREAAKKKYDELVEKYGTSYTTANNSRIIWTSAWNGKNLQASYFANGELQKAQVLVASRFKNEEGELIDLFTKEGNDYKYITKTDTGWKLKESMFSKELLSLISFRIPTSGHQSASQIEIAGFLPYESADLMIVPKNFTKQKGLDFDIDKENTYQFWNFLNEDGTFETLEEKHRNKILSRADRMMQSIKEGKTAEDKIILAMFGDEISYTAEDIAGDKFLSKLNSKITEKLLQNELIKIHHSVLGSNNPKVQSKVNKTLNTDYAEAQANMIEQLTQGEGDRYWTPLSDEYQKQKMFLGASGKIGTGAYSLDVVGHSLFQQAALNGQPIQLIKTVEDEITPIEWRFGNIKSNGTLGGSKTLDGSRSISEVMAERQNVAVDNEKLQVMGRVNLNDLTMDVDKTFNMLGIDKGEDGNSIPFLFLSQPIIIEYVEMMKNANSNVAEFDANKEMNIVSALLTKYEPVNAQYNSDEEYWNLMEDQMTNANFIKGIKDKGKDGALQGAILKRFIDMKEYGVAIRNIQTTINTDSKGLGKSFFDVIEKRNALNRLGVDTSKVTGADALIGEYINSSELTQAERESYIQDGYVDIGEMLVLPTTLSGAFNLHGVATAYNLWHRYFPYDAAVTNEAFSQLMNLVGSETMSDSSIVEKKQDIFRAIKKFLATSKKTGITEAETTQNEERYRLYIDDDNNTSLAKYIKTIREMENNAAINQFIKSNKLINRFEFDIQKNGLPSLIKFNNAAGEEFDEQYLYESLATLLEFRERGEVQLPTVGNKSYTLTTLAQDLIAYVYLGNAIQEAIQFTKYVPMSYLNEVGFSRIMKAANMQLEGNYNLLGLRLTNKDEEKHLVGDFVMQYMQHNPEKLNKAFKMSMDEMGKRTIKIDDNSFYMKDEQRPTFISVYDPSIPKGDKKFRLYWFDGSKYTRVPVLGTFGMDEYSPRVSIGQSIIANRTQLKISPQESSVEEAAKSDAVAAFPVGNIKDTITAISTSSTTFAPLAKHLLPFAKGVEVVISHTVMTSRGATSNFRGYYDRNLNRIIIHPSIITNAEDMANFVLHEFVHHLTESAVRPHITTDATTGIITVAQNAPAYVSALVRLFNNLRANIDGEKIGQIKQKLGQQPLTQEEMTNFYGFVNIYEFMSMALTDSGFQQVLNNIEYKNTGKTFLDKFKEIVSAILTSLGVKFDENYTAAHAISAIFDVIDNSNTRNNSSPYGDMEDYNNHLPFMPQIEQGDALQLFLDTLTPDQKRC